jgi:hypothetical protein
MNENKGGGSEKLEEKSPLQEKHCDAKRYFQVRLHCRTSDEASPYDRCLLA